MTTAPTATEEQLREVRDLALEAATARARLEEAIVTARRAGWPLRTVAGHAAVSAQTIANIERRHGA